MNHLHSGGHAVLRPEHLWAHLKYLVRADFRSLRFVPHTNDTSQAVLISVIFLDRSTSIGKIFICC